MQINNARVASRNTRAHAREGPVYPYVVEKVITVFQFALSEN